MTDTARFRATTLGDVLASEGRKASWLADQAKISRFLMSHLLAGRRTVKREAAEAMAAALGQPLSALFELSNDTETSPMEASAA